MMLDFLKKKKEFGLALGGGAARGFAHIGVIRYLEEHGLRASEVSGTSMGSIIGALYAYGKTSDEMEKIASEINYFKFIDIDLKKGLVKGNKIMDFLKGIFGNVFLEELQIPLKIISTDIATGEKVVFDRGRLVDAIRASISIPGIIMPYKILNHELVDGGIVNNLPIEELSCKDILAVSVLRDVRRPIEQKLKVMGFEIKHNLFGLNYQILQKTIDIMMKQNEDRSLDSGKNIIYIKPNAPKIDYYEFHKFKEIIEEGYRSVKLEGFLR